VTTSQALSLICKSLDAALLDIQTSLARRVDDDGIGVGTRDNPAASRANSKNAPLPNPNRAATSFRKPWQIAHLAIKAEARIGKQFEKNIAARLAGA